LHILFALFGEEKNLALPGNRTKASRFYNLLPGHYTDYANPAPIIRQFRGSSFLVHKAEEALHVTAVSST